MRIALDSNDPRRGPIHRSTVILCLASFLAIAIQGPAQAEDRHQTKVTFEQYIRECAVSRDVIEGFLKGPSWAKFDPELGYVQRDYVRHDAIDDSSAIYTFRRNGARTSFMYADRKPRINTYGDSFTESEQVNDGETWQEYLAGHLGEPIGNYGIGSYGVYQAYRRMIREERTDHGAEYLIFYIWGDDSTRSLMRCRYCSIYTWMRGSSEEQGARGFHANFWTNMEMDLRTGRFVERENPLPTSESLYHMTDSQWLFDHLKDDLALELSAYSKGAITGLDREEISILAIWLDFPFDWSLESRTDRVLSPDPDDPPMTRMQAQAAALLNRYSQRATIYVLDKARAFASQNGKKLLIVLFDPYEVMNQMRQNTPRNDQETVDYLIREKMNYFDMNEVHLRDFGKYNVSWDEYIRQYFIGHYNPRGNHFFAYSIKGKVVDWLDPKPITYRNPDAETLDFKGYLQGYR